MQAASGQGETAEVDALVGRWLDLQVVVVGVLSQAAVEEGPGEVVHRILLVGDDFGHNFCCNVVMQGMIQVALHRERLEQELLVVLLPGCMAHEHTPASHVQFFSKAGLQVSCTTKSATGCTDRRKGLAVGQGQGRGGGKGFVQREPQNAVLGSSGHTGQRMQQAMGSCSVDCQR